MDQRAYIDPVTNRTLAIIDGKQYAIYINAGLKIGERVFREFPVGVQAVDVRHTDDLVWHLVWKNFLISERVKAHRYLRNLAITTRVSLGFQRHTWELSNDFPLPFDTYEYNFT